MTMTTNTEPTTTIETTTHEPWLIGTRYTTHTDSGDSVTVSTVVSDPDTFARVASFHAMRYASGHLGASLLVPTADSLMVTTDRDGLVSLSMRSAAGSVLVHLPVTVAELRAMLDEAER